MRPGTAYSHTHVQKVDDIDVVMTDPIDLGIDMLKEFIDQSSVKSLGLFRGHYGDRWG